MSDKTIKYYENINKECCCFRMRRVSRAITNFFDMEMAASGIRSTQFTFLVSLKIFELRKADDSKIKLRFSLTEISKYLVMDRTTLTRNISNLKKSGFVYFVPVDGDKRVKRYLLTEKGESTLELALPLWKKAQEKFLGMVDKNKYNDLLRELKFLGSLSKFC